jgi:hypothetical protein
MAGPGLAKCSRQVARLGRGGGGRHHPVGDQVEGGPPHLRFDDARDLERFLAGPLRRPRREILEALRALDHHGRYVIHEVWLSPDEMTALA